MSICKTSDRYFYSPRLTHHELRILSALSTQAMKLEALRALALLPKSLATGNADRQGQATQDVYRQTL